MITVGLDFGTHQTKICIEDRNRVETHYKFLRFLDLEGNLQYTLPSIICITPDQRLKYGFVENIPNGVYKRYFKQAVYRDNNSPEMTLWEAARYSIWYLAYILFDLEAEYGQEFSVQMGAPTDSETIDDKKAIAVSILASAYRLVENVFENDKEAFLQTKLDKLIELTEIVKFSEDVKRDYQILVFPEAYACLLPMISKGKISHGMSLVVDIGGGTTDISFFTIEEKERGHGFYQPQVYDFFSLNKGLNYLTEPAISTHKDILQMLQFFSEKKLNEKRLEIYFEEILKMCNNLISKLKSEWKSQTKFKEFRLTERLKKRPIIYTGGGCTIPKLQNIYQGFSDKYIISYESWRSKDFDDQTLFMNRSLCPILSTAYGLSISMKNDIIKKKPFRDIFKDVRGQGEIPIGETFGHFQYNFDYGLDYEAWK